jgi:hypothetical protein
MNVSGNASGFLLFCSLFPLAAFSPQQILKLISLIFYMKVVYVEKTIKNLLEMSQLCNPPKLIKL